MEIKTLKFLRFYLFFILAALFLLQGISFSQNLGQTKKQMQETERKLQQNRSRQLRLSNEKQKLQKAILQLETKKKQNSKKLKEFAKELEKNKRAAAELRRNLEALDASKKRLSGDLSGVFLLYFQQKNFASDYYGMSDLRKNILLHRALSETGSRFINISRENEKAKKIVDGVERVARKLENGRMGLLRDQRSGDKQKKEISRKINKNEKTAKELIAEEKKLKKAKEALEQLFRAAVARDNAASQQANKNSGGQNKTNHSQDAAMHIPRKSLAWPAEGSIIEPYSGMIPGIKVAVSQGTQVRAVMAGKVDSISDSGDVLGRMILIRHGDGLFTAYSLLEEISVNVGDTVGPKTVLGRAGKDRTEISNSYPGKKFYLFFIRFNGSMLDPEEWLR